MSMFAQQDAPSFRHRLWLVLWFVVIVAVLWALVWLLFFHDSSPKVSTVNGSKASQKQSSGGSQPSSSSSSAGSNSTSGGSGAAPDQLANAGAGNILVPFSAAGVAGTAAYYIRLRRKLQQQ